jgi:hypothetical protein
MDAKAVSKTNLLGRHATGDPARLDATYRDGAKETRRHADF